MLKTIITFLLITFTAWSCPFDEADVEVTIVAHSDILKASNSGDFEKATEEIRKQKKLYEYFEKVDNKPLYQPLLDASKDKNGTKIKQLLDHSLILEIKELLGKVEESFDKYQKSRLLLIKTKKHLKALTKDKKAMEYMRNIFKSIGNPGVMGMGKKPSDKKQFLENRDILLAHLNNQ